MILIKVAKYPYVIFNAKKIRIFIKVIFDTENKF